MNQVFCFFKKSLIMRFLFSFIIILFTVAGFSQNDERVLVDGQINVPEGENPDGISVVNISAMMATVSDEQGEFEIMAAAGDTLQFASLQFQDFSVIVDDGVVDKRQVNVFVSEAVNVLPEVIVMPYDLSGNVRVDVDIIPSLQVRLPDQSAAEISPYEWEFPPDTLVSPPSAAMREGMIYSGNSSNMANAFRHIFTTRDVINDLDPYEDLDEELKELRDDDFFEEHLNIEEDRIPEFISYAAENGLTPEMLKPENELALIEFLVAKSFEFKRLD